MVFLLVSFLVPELQLLDPDRASLMLSSSSLQVVWQLLLESQEWEVSFLLGGGFLELTGLASEADLPSLLLLPSLSEAFVDLLFSLVFLGAIPSETAFLRTRSACASTRLEEWLLASIPKDSHNAIISLFVTSNSLASS